MIISGYYGWGGSVAKRKWHVSWALAKGQKLTGGWGRRASRGRNNMCQKLGGRKSLAVQGVWISRGMDLERSNWSWMPATKTPLLYHMKMETHSTFWTKVFSTSSSPWPGGIWGRPPPFTFQLEGANELYMARRQKLGAGLSKLTAGPCPACPVLLPGTVSCGGKGGKGNCRKDSILATHSAAEIHWAYLHWLFRIKWGHTFGEGEGKESLF